MVEQSVDALGQMLGVPRGGQYFKTDTIDGIIELKKTLGIDPTEPVDQPTLNQMSREAGIQTDHTAAEDAQAQQQSQVQQQVDQKTAAEADKMANKWYDSETKRMQTSGQQAPQVTAQQKAVQQPLPAAPQGSQGLMYQQPGEAMGEEDRVTLAKGARAFAEGNAGEREIAKGIMQRYFGVGTKPENLQQAVVDEYHNGRISLQEAQSLIQKQKAVDALMNAYVQHLTVGNMDAAQKTLDVINSLTEKQKVTSVGGNVVSVSDRTGQVTNTLGKDTKGAAKPQLVIKEVTGKDGKPFFKASTVALGEDGQYHEVGAGWDYGTPWKQAAARRPWTDEEVFNWARGILEGNTPADLSRVPVYEAGKVKLVADKMATNAGKVINWVEQAANQKYASTPDSRGRLQFIDSIVIDQIPKAISLRKQVAKELGGTDIPVLDSMWFTLGRMGRGSTTAALYANLLFDIALESARAISQGGAVIPQERVEQEMNRMFAGYTVDQMTSILQQQADILQKRKDRMLDAAKRGGVTDTKKFRKANPGETPGQWLEAKKAWEKAGKP